MAYAASRANRRLRALASRIMVTNLISQLECDRTKVPPAALEALPLLEKHFSRDKSKGVTASLGT